MSLAYDGILHSSILEMSEEGLKFNILCSLIPGNCGLGVVGQDQLSEGCKFDSTLRPLYLFFTE
jgi:hypothetical protein